MKNYAFLLLVFVSLLACKDKNQNESSSGENEIKQNVPFDENKWKIKEGDDYPFRESMVKDILKDMELRKLNKDQFIEKFGEANKVNENHYYYLVAQKRLNIWPLHTTTLVVKLNDENMVEWIKLHK